MLKTILVSLLAIVLGVLGVNGISRREMRPSVPRVEAGRRADAAAQTPGKSFDSAQGAAYTAIDAYRENNQ